MKIATCSGWNDSGFPLFKKMNVLTIPLLFQYETAKLVHKHSSKNIPVNLFNYFIVSKNIHPTRSITNENLETPLFRLQRTQNPLNLLVLKSIIFSIPRTIRKSSFQNFKNCSKHIYFTHMISIVLSFYTQSTNCMVHLSSFIY